MWKRGRNGIIYKLQSHWDESCSNFTKLRHSVFSPGPFLPPKECWWVQSTNWRRNMRSCQLARDLLSGILIQLHTASFASGDHSMLQRHWETMSCAIVHGEFWMLPCVTELVAIDHSALPNFEKLQPENWFIALGFDTWVYMHVLWGKSFNF